MGGRTLPAVCNVFRNLGRPVSDSRAVPCYVIILRRAGQPDRRIVLDSLSDALAAARHDAAWLAGIGSVFVSPLLDVRRYSAEKG